MSRIESLYSPTKGMVRCVLLQAVHNLDDHVPNLFDNQDWILQPDPNLYRMSAILEKWRFLASLGRQERIDRWVMTSAGEDHQ